MPHLAHHHRFQDQFGLGALCAKGTSRAKWHSRMDCHSRIAQLADYRHCCSNLNQRLPTCTMRSSTVLRATKRNTSTPRSCGPGRDENAIS